MKIEKSNNPAAVGALVLVLVLIVGRIVWMVIGHNESVAAASTASAGPPVLPPPVPAAGAAPAVAATPTAPAPDAARLPSAVTPITTRNPFCVATPAGVAVVHPLSPPRDGGAAHVSGTAPAVLRLTALAPLPAPILKPGPGAAARPPASDRPGRAAATPDPASKT